MDSLSHGWTFRHIVVHTTKRKDGVASTLSLYY